MEEDIKWGDEYLRLQKFKHSLMDTIRKIKEKEDKKRSGLDDVIELTRYRNNSKPKLSDYFWDIPSAYEQLIKAKYKNMKQQIEGYYIKSKGDKVIQEEDNIIVFNLIKSPNKIYEDRKVLRLILEYFKGDMSKPEQDLIKELIAISKVIDKKTKLSREIDWA